jgi:hypothetical protein
MISITTRAGTFCASRRDAQVCRRSWKRMRRTPALVISSSKKRFKLRGSITVPTVEVKTRPESIHAGAKRKCFSSLIRAVASEHPRRGCRKRNRAARFVRLRRTEDEAHLG